jgi:Family of unknown function (DUF5317)
MFILYALVAGLAIGLATRGRLAGLGSIHVRWAPLILLGFLVQVILFTDAVASRVGAAGPVLYVASTLLVVAAVLRNLSLPGIPLVALGAASNMVAIVANGGFMPAAPGAVAALGKAAPTIYSNSAVVAQPAFELLTDRYALPRWVPFTNVFSIGDVLLAVGIFLVIVAAMHRGGRPMASGAEPQLPLSS